MSFPQVTHVIFDLDGLLLDTEKLYSVAIDAIVQQYNAVYTFEIKQQVMGRSQLEACQIIIDCLKLPLTAADFLKKLEEQFESLFPKSELMPGAERLIRHLSSHSIPLAICTGSNKTYYDLKVNKAGHSELFRLMSHVVCSPDDPEVKRSKPFPDPFQVTASRFPTQPQSPNNVLVFEDAPNGVMAALAADMQVVLVPDPRLTGPALEKATLVLQTLEDFNPTMFGLPGF